MEKKCIKDLLKKGFKVATQDMINNGDFLYLKGNTVYRTWGGNENLIGDKYFSPEKDNSWQVCN